MVSKTDDLKTIPNGKYQFPLWQVRLTASAIVFTDKRSFISKPSDAITAENYTANGGIASKFSSVNTNIKETLHKSLRI